MTMADMDIYIYPNKSTDGDMASNSKSGITDALSQVTSNTSIGTYDVTIRDDIYPEISINQSASEFMSDFTDWRYSVLYDSDGSHFCVNGGNMKGLAQGGDGSSSNAFVDDRSAVMGYVGSSSAYRKNISIMEVFHNFINNNNADVADMITDSEHDLGDITTAGYSRPMCTGYENDSGDTENHADHGTCSSDWSWVEDYYTTEVSTCTEDALEATFTTST